jgi:hypothetical protein
MTVQTTAQQPATPDRLQELLVVQAATLLTLEAGAAYAATSAIRQAIAMFIRSANGRWMLAGADPASPTVLPRAEREQVATALTRQLRTIAADIEQDLPGILRQEAEHALQLGAVHAGQQIGLTIDPGTLRLDPIADALIQSTPKAAASHITQGARLLERATTGLELQTATAEAGRAVTATITGSTYLTNHVANDAAKQVAVRIGQQLLWIAERDACVVCLALSGHLADPNAGIGFDEFATFGPYPAPTVWPPGMPLMRPPRHPHCRCQVCVWLGSAPGQPSLPERLRHEARRSILKGWSLPSESRTVRLRAASGLLASGGGGLPKSVQEEARLALARGRFTSREVPHYQPKKKEKSHV